MDWSVAIMLVSSASCLVLTGCVAEEADGDGVVSEAEGAFINANSMNANSMNANALSAAALSLNTLSNDALKVNGLTPAALSSIQDPGPAGDLAREALRYVVSCALNPSDSFAFSWTDSDGITHNEAYQGLMGLTPNWLQGPIVSSEAKWISACLASRVNWYGISVELSSRGTNNALSLPGAAEVSAFANKEGAFWGNLFTGSPEMFSCYAASGVSTARAQLRDCAAGHLSAAGGVETCGIIQIVGPCSVYCSPPHPSYGYHAHCGTTPGAPDSATQVVTVFLR